MDMGSRRMQIVGIVLAVLMAAMLAVTLWAYRPVSLAEAADARTGLEPKVAVVVRLDELDGNGTFHEYQAYDPALLEQMELLVDTAQLRLVRRSSTAPLDGMCMVLIIGEDNIICSFDYNLDTNAIYIGDRITRSAPPSRRPSPSWVPPSAGRCRPWACNGSISGRCWCWPPHWRSGWGPPSGFSAQPPWGSGSAWRRARPSGR